MGYGTSLLQEALPTYTKLIHLRAFGAWYMQRLGFFLLLLAFPSVVSLVECLSCILPFVFPTWGVQIWVGVWRVWRPHEHVLSSQLSPEVWADVQIQVLCCQGMNVSNYCVSSQHVFILVFIQLC